jgi:hypothetical protein
MRAGLRAFRPASRPKFPHFGLAGVITASDRNHIFGVVRRSRYGDHPSYTYDATSW